MNKLKLKFLIGLPASGKSTYAKEFCEKNTDWVRVNRDDIRHMRGKYWLPKDEKMITEMEDVLITIALNAGKNVMVDATNLNKSRVSDRITNMRSSGYVFEAERKYFLVDPEICVERDSKRENPVGGKVIMDMYNKYLKPPTVGDKQDHRLPPAIIVDIDGTLAKMTDRGPFEWKRVGEDELHNEIAWLVRALYHTGVQVILMSGRDGSCRGETEDWLLKNLIPYHYLLMREAGNNEKDSALKRRLFMDNVYGKYFVKFVLDDRDQVVRMWRNELGLKCLQVAEGNF